MLVCIFLKLKCIVQPVVWLLSIMLFAPDLYIPKDAWNAKIWIVLQHAYLVLLHNTETHTICILGLSSSM